jgi:ubiquinone biosynthesis protein
MPEPLPGPDDGSLGPAAGGGSAPHAARRRRKRRAAPEVLVFPPRPGPSAPATSGTIAAAIPPRARTERASAGIFRVAFRLVELSALIVYFAGAGCLDWVIVDWRYFVLRRRSQLSRSARLADRRADRLSRVLELLGGTFIKIGQQLAIRADVLPQVYCDKLEHLLDQYKYKPIPEDYVRRVVERHTGKRIAETFVTPFDYSPLGSASIACVYKATLASGEVVAVKVRRPKIVKIFTADLKALDLVLRTAEFLTLLRPGITASFRSEIREMLLDELDFHAETRYQELFRRYFKRRKKLRTTAPKLYFDLCGRDLLVSDFVDGTWMGIWMKDLMGALKSGDTAYREALRVRGIDPESISLEKIAKLLIRGSHYGFFECPFFQGDPHPGNILIQPGNHIVMVDFGACGVFAERERHQLAQLHYYEAREDIGGMVQGVISLMEPLPPIDVDAFRRGLEDAWWKGFYGVKSRHAQWWERTSFQLWTALLGQVREYRIPLPLNVLRMIRATLLYDTVAASIYADIDVFKEYRKYYNGYARRVQRRIQRSLVRQLLCGPDPANYVRLARLWDVGNVLLQRAQVFLEQPLPNFAALVSKGFDLLMVGLKWFLMSTMVTGAALLAGIWLAFGPFGQPRPARDTAWDYPREFLHVLRHSMSVSTLHRSETVMIVWLALMVLIALKYLRQAWFRLSDKDFRQLGGQTVI